MTATLAGISREDQAMISYFDDSGVRHVVTTTTNHSKLTSAGEISNHVKQGTDGKGLAIDVVEKIGGGRDTVGLLAIRNALKPVEHLCSEIIYAGPGAPPCIRHGRPFTYDASVLADHHDHVHVAVPFGVFLHWIPTVEEASKIMNKPACRILPTPSGHGYYIVGQDGGIFSFGDAHDGNLFSVAGEPHNALIVDAALSPSGNGILFLAADGGVDARGDAEFHGSAA